MPCNYKEYHPKWSLIRRLILKRAKNKCEWCGVHNHEVGARHLKTGEFKPLGRIIWEEGIKTSILYGDAIKIVLTIAHIDHNKNNNKFSNLAALCQKCHLNHDRHLHVNNRKYGKRKNQIKIDFKTG